jgi:hypothetical protein
MIQQVPIGNTAGREAGYAPIATRPASMSIMVPATGIRIIGTFLFFAWLYLWTSAFSHAEERPKYCIDACTGRFCVFRDGTQMKQMCWPDQPRSCIKNYKGVLKARPGCGLRS